MAENTQEMHSVLLSSREFEEIIQTKFIFPENAKEKLFFVKLLKEIAATQVGTQLLREFDKNKKITLNLNGTQKGFGEHTMAGEIFVNPQCNAQLLIHELEHERQLQKGAIGSALSYDHKVINTVLSEVFARMVEGSFAVENDTPSWFPSDAIRINYFKEILKNKYPHDRNKLWTMAV